MKKRTVKNLRLNKSNVSNFIEVIGGRAPDGTLGGNPSAFTDNCPFSIPYTDCNCGSNFNDTCGSFIGHC